MKKSLIRLTSVGPEASIRVFFVGLGPCVAIDESRKPAVACRHKAGWLHEQSLYAVCREHSYAGALVDEAPARPEHMSIWSAHQTDQP